MRPSHCPGPQASAVLILAVALTACPPSPRGNDDAGALPDAGVETANGDGGAFADAGAPPDGGELVDGGPHERHEVLFIGNSFIFVNDVAGQYRTMARGLWADVRVEEVAPGGYRLEQHTDDARTDGTPLARWLRTGAPEETSFDAVILQEQSQIGGYPTYTAARRASVAAASELAALARARGARVVLYLTWGYEHGDPSNSLLGFGTYPGMQDQLDEGYLGLAALLREQGSTVLVAPVGGGFRIVFEDVTRAGGDPLMKGSDFDALYEPDGIHPSLRGAYLAACIIAGTITGADVLAFAAEPALGQSVSDQLLDVCARALVDPRWHVPDIQRAERALPGAGAFRYFGAGVATTADGSRILVGAPAMTNASAQVFARSDAGWSEEANWDGGALFGTSVALSGDGSRALAGPPTLVQLRSGATWSEEKVLSPGPAAKNQESTGMLTLSADASRAVVSEGSGWPVQVRVPVFVRDGGSWEEEAVLESVPVFGSGPTVSIDGTGERVIVGAFGGRSVRIYARSPSGWAEEATLVSQGTRVALSADGSRAIVGDPAADAAALFIRSSGGWSEEAAVHGRMSSGFGSAVSLSADGRRALVGAPHDAPAATGASTGAATGSARLYEVRDAGLRHERLLVPRMEVEGGLRRFGAAAALSSDGKSAVVGAPGTDSPDGGLNVGSAHTFVLP